ncbi:MAG: hypothetical protein B6244_12465 [Candidatus Cloacimonetes bacterium 4572_55]|nr:MAG: hypothetical protein B6244_12465 [Candidatus Cloacimonetes bacterium 4572_55]
MDAMDIKEYIELWKMIIMNPQKFFQEWDQSEDWTRVLLLNAICGLLAGILLTIFTLGGGVLAIVMYPIGLIIGTFISGAIYYLCFKLLGGTGEIESTIKMVGYTNAISLVSLGVPIIGSILGLYQIWLLIVGGKVVHKLDTGKSAIAVIIPLVLCCLIPIIVFGMTVGLGFFTALMGQG